MSFLVDTNVLRQLSRAIPDPGVISWARVVDRIAVSVVTVEEVHVGLSCKSIPRVEQWFERFLGMQCRVIPVTEAIARQSGLLRGRPQAGGSNRTQADMLIAATAQVHALTLVTLDERDFEGCGVAVLNPFSG